MSRLYRALRGNKEVFQELEIKNNRVMMMKNLSNLKDTEPKAVFLTTLKAGYVELKPEKAVQYEHLMVEVAETTAPTEKATKPAKEPKAPKEPKAEKTAKEPKAEKEPKAPKEPTASATEQIEDAVKKALEGTTDVIDIQDKFLSINGTRVLRILKDGVSIRESVAKANELPFEHKGYNHPFKAKISATTVEELTKLLPLVKVVPVEPTEEPATEKSVEEPQLQATNEKPVELAEEEQQLADAVAKDFINE